MSIIDDYRFPISIDRNQLRKKVVTSININDFPKVIITITSLKSDWLLTALISALIGQFNRTVSVMPSRACLNVSFFHC